MAYIEHERICNEWRKQGRPALATHPARIAKLKSQRNLQKITREEESLKAQKDHEELMNTFNMNINQIYNKLKKIRGYNMKNVDIPFIETLNGTFSGQNVLEGFCSDTADLDHSFYKMCIQDNMILLDIANEEPINIPHMSLEALKNIIFKKLKLNKACDINKLTVGMQVMNHSL